MIKNLWRLAFFALSQVLSSVKNVTHFIAGTHMEICTGGEDTASLTRSFYKKIQRHLL